MEFEKVIIKDRINIPKDLISLEDIEDRYSINIFKEKNCKRCDNLPERLALGGPNDLCVECPSFLASYKLFKETDTHWSVPQGDELTIRKMMDKKGVTVVDKRPEYPFINSIKFTANLFGKNYIDENGYPRIDQQALVAKYMKHETGILCCRPRAGKCISGNSMTMTSKGFLSMEELSSKNTGFTPANFSITTHKGNREVSHTYRDKSKTIKLLTYQGFEVEGTPEHPVLTLANDLTYKWKNISDVKVGDYLVSNHKGVEPLWGSSDTISEDLARILGWMTANGFDERFSSSIPKVIFKFKSACEKEFGKTPISRNVDGINTPYHTISRYDYKPLAELGYSPKNSADKEIPLEIRKSSKAILSAYLDAYFECDSGRDGESIIICSASSKLIYQLQNLLLMGFGILSVRSSRKNFARNSNTPSIKEYYQLNIHGQDSYKFCKEFPSAKAAKDYHKLQLTDSRQSWLRDHIPYAAKLIKKCSDLKFTKVKSLGYWSNAYKLEDGSVKEHQFHPSIKRNKNQIGRASWDCPKFQEDLAFIAQIDRDLGKKLNFINTKEIRFLKVVKKTVSNKKKDVFDLSVPGIRAYYSNGIVCHNTSMSLYIAIQLGQRTVILAHKKALLRQFYNTLTRSEPFPFTNIHELQSEVKKPIVLWAQTRAQLKKYKECDFLLVNYQKFVRTPDELASIINGHFSTIIVDEAHNSGAEGYLKVVSKCNVKHRIGLSATPKRKDGRHKMISLIMGPVVAKSESVSLIPKITLVQSRVTPKTNYKQWHSAVEFIFSSKERNKEIISKVIEDIKAGHKAIIIPVDHLKHQEYLAKEFNKIQEDMAICWNEKSDEEKVLKRVEDPSRTTILIAIRSMIREGVDLLKPSCMHVVVPMTAEADDGIGAPMFDQLVNRVCTPAPNKPKPIVRVWVDNVKMFQGCLKSLFFGEIWPNRYNPEIKKGKYEVDKHLVSVVSSLGKDKGTVFKRNWS